MKNLTLADRILKNTPQTTVPYSEANGRTGAAEIRIPNFPIPIPEVYNIAYNSDIIRQSINAIRDEAFRRGYEILPAFDHKCTNEDCGEEYDYKLDQCKTCGSPVKTPNGKQYKKLEKFLKKVNAMEQDVIEFSKAHEDDLNIAKKNYPFIHYESFRPL